MDSLSISATLLSVLTLVQESAKFISATARPQDPKFDQIYHRLLAEKKRTEEWASHMRVFNSTNLRVTVPPEEYDAVVVHFEKMDTCYKKAHDKFSAIEDAAKGPVDPTALRAGTTSLFKGYDDDLKEFVDTLAAMNSIFRSIASPLSKYSSLVIIHNNSLAANPFSVSEAAAQNVHEAAGIYESTTTASVHTIYQATLDTLIALSVRQRDPQIARCASRLKLWGAGLFKMSIPLDVVFASDKDGCQLIRNCILKVLVEILVWEGE